MLQHFFFFTHISPLSNYVFTDLISTIVLLVTGYIKILFFWGLPLKPSGLHVMQYQSFSDMSVSSLVLDWFWCWDALLYLCLWCQCRLVFHSLCNFNAILWVLQIHWFLVLNWTCKYLCLVKHSECNSNSLAITSLVISLIFIYVYMHSLVLMAGLRWLEICHHFKNILILIYFKSISNYTVYFELMEWEIDFPRFCSESLYWWLRSC